MDKGKLSATLQRAVRITVLTYGAAAVIALTLVLLFIPWWIQWCLLYLGGILFLTSVFAPFVDDCRPKPRVPTRGKAVFISGCDSGFGHNLARRLDDLGLHVFAGCLFPEKEGAQVLKVSCSDRLHVVPLDVTSDKSVQDALKYVTDNIGNNKFWAVVNNAGINEGCEVTWTSLETAKRIFEVNTFGVVRVTKTFLPLLCQEKGRIITVASAVGRYTLPAIVPYCMSKYAAISFCEGLRLEMYQFGVKVITIEPWAYRTSIMDGDNIWKYFIKTWEEAPSDVKALYPANYLEYVRPLLDKSLNFSTSDKLQNVVNCLEEAILALDPKYAYSPGTLKFRLSFWILKRLPKPIADAFLQDQLGVPLSHED